MRTLSIIVAPERTPEIIDHVRGLKGAGSLQLQKGGSINPPGDSITLLATNGAAIKLEEWLKERGIGKEKGSSFSISEPSSISSAQLDPFLEKETNQGTSGETQSFLHKPVATDINTYIIMFGAGIFAAAGIITDAIHLALAGFMFAPGFQPIMLITYGLTNKTPDWKIGLKQFCLMYLCLLAGAIVASLLLQFFGKSLLAGDPAYLPEAGILINYWATLNWTAYFIAATAGFTGTFAVSSRQPSLIPAVTVAVALIPSMCIVGIGIVAGEMDVISTALSRWAVEVGLIVVFSSIALWLQKILKKSYVKN